MATKTVDNGEKKLATAPPAPSWVSPWSSMEHMFRVFDRMWGKRAAFHFPEMPSLNMHRNDHDLVVEAAMPGMEKADIKVNVSGQTLTIEGEHREEKTVEEKDRYLTELHRGHVFRQVQLPVEVEASKVKADYKAGVLTVTLPMAEPARNAGVNVTVH